METLTLLVLTVSLLSSTGFPGDTGHDRYMQLRFAQFDQVKRQQSAQLDQLVDQLAKSNTEQPDLTSLTELQNRMEQAQREIEREMMDLTKGESNICPIHHIPMQAKDAPIAYGLLLAKEPAPTWSTRTFTFPFAEDWIRGGCVYSSEFPKTGRVYLCPKCVKAEKAWLKAHRR